MRNKPIFNIKIPAVSAIALGALVPYFSLAGSLFMAPSTGIYEIGEPFSVSIRVNTGGAGINAAEANLAFDPKQLQVVEISKKDSIFTFWTEEPRFNNVLGQIQFAGGTSVPVDSPAGNILRITFKGMANANSRLEFIDGALIAADGRGTNIASQLMTGTFTVRPEITVAEAAAIPSIVPGAPLLNSPSHPVSNSWYSNPNGRFNWTIAPDVEAIRVSANRLPASTPTTFYEPAISDTRFTLPEGVSYVHLQQRNADGWGPAGHYMVQVDTEEPEYLSLRVGERDDLTEPRVVLSLDSSDRTSGIANYEIQIDKGPAVMLDGGIKSYTTETLPPGKHVVAVRVHDRAGNTTVESAEFVIAPIQRPEITEFPLQHIAGQMLVVKGKASAGETVELVFVDSEGARISESTRSDNNGEFLLGTKELKNGMYRAFAVARDDRGAQSLPTDPITFLVEPSKLMKFAGQVLAVLTAVVPVLALVFALGYALLRLWYRFMRMRKRLRAEIETTEKDLHRIFHELKDEINGHLSAIEKARSVRVLTHEERHLLQELKTKLANAERRLGKEMKAIEEDIT